VREKSEALMLFDLRVVLAACLATFLFVAIGLGLLAASHSPFKPPKGYARNDGAALAGPGLPKSRRLPVLEEAKSEDVTGSIAETTVAPEPEPALEPVPAPVPTPPVPPKHARPARPAPQLSTKNPAPSIATLIEQDEKAKAKPKPVKKRPHHVRHRAKKKPPPTNPWSIFTNNNNNPTPQRPVTR
jgi:hypothetical protein